ncbi:NAD(P)/FAD-dependent oxidoreductase [Salirhabdus salicampi]|uniref:NAD(P)/FAD-dependent oxidoreductase n=1 Tax=Salirhabdus salicampi TaxID=476102 RepID=UPI0020C5A166|nr:FAD-dependent oxidoreductase [Salirhabdus salicampi]MCP8616236.1 FAD-binding oxidoreductase [Salirhabdus salicampi]
MMSYIVVGAGILGASTAYHLAKAAVDVTIVDRYDEGQATEAAAGIVCPWLTQRRNKPWYRLVKGGAKYYPSLIEELHELGEKETGYRQVGALSLHSDKTKLNKMEERAYARREDAPEIGEIKRLTPKETQALFPPLSEQYGSVYISGGARVNGRALRDSLIRAARKYGAKVRTGDAKLHIERDEITGIIVDDEVLEGEQVIVTAGAWARDLMKPLDVTFSVSPQKAQIIHLQLRGHDTNDWPVVMPPNNKYILAFQNGKIVMGATHEDEVGFDSRVTAGGIHDIFDKTLSIAPGLRKGSLLEVRVGFRPFTPDFLPVVGPMPYYKGLWLANGLGASGLTSGPYLGAELAKLVLGKLTDLNIDDYNIMDAIRQDS